MTDEQLEALRVLATMAHPMDMVLSPSHTELLERGAGPIDRIVYHDPDGDITETAQARMRFIAVATPAVVLALIAEVERLRDLLRRAAGVLRDLAGMPMEADLLDAQVEEDT